LEKEQERRERVKEKKRNWKSSIKDEHTSKCWRNTKTIIVLTPSLAKKAGDSVGVGKACSNRESKENKYSSSKPTIIVGKICI